MKTQTLIALLSTILLTTACSQKSSTFPTNLKDSSAIVGGTPVTANDPLMKSTALLLIFKVGYKNHHAVITGLSSCTATVLSNNIVVTAGHCSQKDPTHLFLYFSNEIPPDWESFIPTMTTNPLIRRVAAGVTAPAWKDVKGDQETNWGDISVLRFTGDLPSGFVPATLASQDLQLKPNQDVLLAGFGLTKGDPQEKATQLNKVSTKIVDPNFSDTELKVGNTPGKGPCHGDSGGPAYVTAADGTSVLAGITSRSDYDTDPEGKCIGDTIYTRVQSYLTWIADESNKLNNDPQYGTVIQQPRRQQK